MMVRNPMIDLSPDDLSDIRDAVPTLDLVAIRSLRRAGFKIVRQDPDDRQEHEAPGRYPAWNSPAQSPSPRA